MSVEAISWALSQNVKPSTTKFVLVAIANCANGTEFYAWPSVAYLVDATGQDRKTVMAGISRLIQMGYLADTGERRGRTNQVIVYQLKDGTQVQEECIYENHYIYRVTSMTGQFVVGKHSCACMPEQDSEYLGNSRWVENCVAHAVKLEKEILWAGTSQQDAKTQWDEMIVQVITHPLCMNSTENGTVSNSTKNGTINAQQTVPFFPSNSTAFPAKQSQNSSETVPKTVHGTVRNRKVTVKEKEDADFDPIASLLELGVEEQVAKDYMEVRRAKKAAVFTRTALDRMINHSQKAGITVNEAATYCIERSWQGFNSSWYAEAMADVNNNSSAGGLVRWWESDSGILAKGRELGLQPHPGEMLRDFKTRLQKKISNQDQGTVSAPPEPKPAIVVREDARQAGPSKPMPSMANFLKSIRSAEA